MQTVVFFRVHNTQGKPGKSRENLGKLENQGKSQNTGKFFGKSKHSEKTRGIFLHFFSTY